MAAPSDRANQALSGYLAEAGLTPRTLARELNRLFGEGTLAETLPYHWRDAGGVPRPPLPTLTAYVISQRLGLAERTIRVYLRSYRNGTKPYAKEGCTPSVSS